MLAPRLPGQGGGSAGSGLCLGHEVGGDLDQRDVEIPRELAQEFERLDRPPAVAIRGWHLRKAVSRYDPPPACREALLFECLLGMRVLLAVVVEGFGPVGCQVLAVAIGPRPVVRKPPIWRFPAIARRHSTTVADPVANML